MWLVEFKLIPQECKSNMVVKKHHIEIQYMFTAVESVLFFLLSFKLFHWTSVCVEKLKNKQSPYVCVPVKRTDKVVWKSILPGLSAPHRLVLCL